MYCQGDSALHSSHRPRRNAMYSAPETNKFQPKLLKNQWDWKMIHVGFFSGQVGPIFIGELLVLSWEPKVPPPMPPPPRNKALLRDY